jgi:Tfp pilus assembly protein PilV
MRTRPVIRFRPLAAFSLIETMAALMIVTFSIVAILGLFPIGFKQASASILETHGAQLAHYIFATLRTPPFTEVDCFGTTLDLTTLNTTTTPVLLYAAFPVSGVPSISPTLTDDSLYTAELHFQKLSGGDASKVILTLFPRHQPSERLHFQSIIRTF